jgi:hypothetical protein
MRRNVLAVVLVASLTSAWPSHAAQLAVDDSKPQLPAIGITGAIEEADVVRFQELSAARNHALVLLEKSAGGKMAAAIEIGEMIRAKGYYTIVKDYCASACALIWLAGSKRFMIPSAHIGLHQAYNVTGQADGMGNAILGAYLTRLGLSYSAIIYATQAKPGELKWLTVDDAKRIGIPVTVVDLNAQKQNTQ